MNDNPLYNEHLAEQYDLEMLKDRFNLMDRQNFLNIIEDKIPKNHLIIDFGGGTGTDTITLLKKGYRVCLVEPSEFMTYRPLFFENVRPWSSLPPSLR